MKVKGKELEKLELLNPDHTNVQELKLQKICQINHYLQLMLYQLW